MRKFNIRRRIEHRHGGACEDSPVDVVVEAAASATIGDVIDG